MSFSGESSSYEFPEDEFKIYLKTRRVSLHILTPERQDELMLCAACSNGNSDAWEVFFLRYRSFLYTVSLKLCRDHHEAEELASQTLEMLMAKNKLAKFSGKGSLKGWLRAVIAHFFLDKKRKAQRIHLETLTDGNASHSASSSQNNDCERYFRKQLLEDFAGHLTRCMNRLPARKAGLLNLYYFQRQTLGKAAEILHIHESTACRWNSKILKTLKGELVRFLRKTEGWSAKDVMDFLEKCLEYIAQRLENLRKNWPKIIYPASHVQKDVLIMMKHEVIEKFLRRLFPIFHNGKGSEDCPDENILAALVEGDRLPFFEYRKVRRHILRCPLCMEKLLVIRELAGVTGPLFTKEVKTTFGLGPAFRPLASTLAVMVVAGLLYLGGTSLVQISHQVEPKAPTPPSTSSESRKISRQMVDDVKTESAQPGRAEEKKKEPSDRLSGKDQRVVGGVSLPPTEREEDEPPAPTSRAGKKEIAETLTSESFAPEVIRDHHDKETREERTAGEDKKGYAPPKSRRTEKETEERKSSHLRETEQPSQSATKSFVSGAAPQPAEEAMKAQPSLAAARGRSGRPSPARWVENPYQRLATLCKQTGQNNPIHHLQHRTFIEINDFYLELGLCDNQHLPICIETGEEGKKLRHRLGVPGNWKNVFLIHQEEIYLLLE